LVIFSYNVLNALYYNTRQGILLSS
jgi:hypothetical protein